MLNENDHKSKERFVINRKTVDAVVRMIRGEATMRGETSALYFLEEVRILQMEDDAYYVGLFGPADRRKEDGE